MGYRLERYLSCWPLGYSLALVNHPMARSSILSIFPGRRDSDENTCHSDGLPNWNRYKSYNLFWHMKFFFFLIELDFVCLQICVASEPELLLGNGKASLTWWIFAVTLRLRISFFFFTRNLPGTMCACYSLVFVTMPGWVCCFRDSRCVSLNTMRETTSGYGSIIKSTLFPAEGSPYTI